MTPDQEKFVNAMGDTLVSHHRPRTFIRTLRAAENAQTADRLRGVTDQSMTYVEAGEHVLRQPPQRDTNTQETSC